MKAISDILNSRKWQPRKTDTLEGLPIRPPVKQTRLYLDNEYYENGYAALFPHSVTTVYGWLARRAKQTTQICYPSAKDIMEHCGITNRNTVFEALKLFETYNIIAIAHSHRVKGGRPNVYALLDPSTWRPINSINFDTVIQSIKKKRTVSKESAQQYQNQSSNSGTDDTRSHITKSDNEINQDLIKEKETEADKKTEDIKREIFRGTLIMFSPYYEEADTRAAYAELQNNGDASPSFTALKGLLKRWAQEGRIKEKKPMW